jgi:hypothetical protein
LEARSPRTRAASIGAGFARASPRGRRLADDALEGSRERGLGVVADVERDRGDGRARLEERTLRKTSESVS